MASTDRPMPWQLFNLRSCQGYRYDYMGQGKHIKSDDVRAHEFPPLCMFPFAGKQLILVGEFLQLQPVPNLFDEGCYMLKSPLFDFAVSHRFALTKVMC